MKNKKLFAAILAIVIIIAACLSVVAVSGEGVLSGKNGISLDQSRYILYLDSQVTVSPVIAANRKHSGYMLISSNPTIFSVNDNGSITGLKEGIAQLQVVSNGYQATATVIVYESSSSSIIPSDQDGKLSVVFVTSQSAVPSQRVLSGGLAADPGTPPNVPDQIVEGWYTDKDFTAKYDFSTPVTTNLTLYAKWTAGDTPTYDFKSLGSNNYAINKLKYPLVAFKTLVLPSQDNDGNIINTINSNAFQDYIYAETVIIPKSIKIIKDYAFAGCTALKEVIFEEGSQLTTIEAEAFWKAKKLHSINLPAGLTSLGKGAFNECEKLESINLPNGIDTLPQQVFAKTGIISINLINIKTLGAKAFADSANLTTVTNPTSLISVSTEVFVGTKWLTNAYNADNGIAYLGTILISAKSTNFQDITIKDGTTLIADSALRGLSNCIIRMNSAQPPVRGYNATNTDGNIATSITGNKVNIVVPFAYYDIYKTSWNICQKQIYYSLKVNAAADSSGVLEFFVRSYEGAASAVLNSYMGSDAHLDIAGIVAAHEKLGEQAYIERIRKDTFNQSNAHSLQTVNLPVRVGIIETYAFSQLTNLRVVRFTGYYTNNDPKIKLESTYSFNTSQKDFKIVLPAALLSYYETASIWSKLKLESS